jgi:hypothetical protein
LQFLFRFEELLRKKNPNVTLCYWDSRLDDSMEIPPMTVMFSPRFFGNPWGNVVTGPFAHWKTIRGVPLKRDLGAQGSLVLIFVDIFAKVMTVPINVFQGS